MYTPYLAASPVEMRGPLVTNAGGRRGDGRGFRRQVRRPARPAHRLSRPGLGDAPARSSCASRSPRAHQGLRQQADERRLAASPRPHLRNALAHAGKSGRASSMPSRRPPSNRTAPRPPRRRGADQLRPKLPKLVGFMDERAPYVTLETIWPPFAGMRSSDCRPRSSDQSGPDRKSLRLATIRATPSPGTRSRLPRVAPVLI